MWQKLFSGPWPDDDNLLPAAVHEQSKQRIQNYWLTRGWQLVLGEVVIWLVTVYQGVELAWAYGVLAMMIATTYVLGMISPFRILVLQDLAW